MPYVTPLPESVMRWVRALALALVAIYIAVPLALLVDVVAGPFPREWLRVLILVLAGLAFAALVRLDRYRRARAAERERLGLAPPPGGTNMLFTGILALGFAAIALHWVLAPDIEDRSQALNAFSMFLAGGVAAVTLGARRIRDRRRWRAARDGNA